MCGRLVALVGMLTAALVAAAGCHCHSCNRCPAPCSSGYIAPVAVPAPARQYYQPPLSSGQLPLQRGYYQPPIVAAPQPPILAERRPAATGTWQPIPGTQPRVAETRPLPLPDRSARAKLNVPEPMEPAKPPDTSVPGVREEPSTSPKKADLAIEIPKFDLVYERVAAGLQPFPDGFALLKERGYRTVLHIQPAGEDATALRTDVEGKGLGYLSLAVSPRALNRELVEQFSKTVRDAGNQPLFVFDRKGQLAGVLWYLHFRLTDGLPETEARKKAVRLGLNEDTTGDNAELWLAINQILRGL